MVVKIALCLAVAFLLVSCGERSEWADTVVTNRSDRHVQFRFYHAGPFSLAPGASVAFGTAHHQNMEWFSYYPHEEQHRAHRPEGRGVWFEYFATNAGVARGYFRLPCACFPAPSDEGCNCDWVSCGRCS